jgi:hypothetical protein
MKIEVTQFTEAAVVVLGKWAFWSSKVAPAERSVFQRLCSQPELMSADGIRMLVSSANLFQWAACNMQPAKRGIVFDKYGSASARSTGRALDHLQTIKRQVRRNPSDKEKNCVVLEGLRREH